jgi:Tol biopolymer transport system component
MKNAIGMVLLVVPLAVSPSFGQTCGVMEIASAGLAEPMWPILSGHGTAVVFRSDHDLVPGSNTDGSWELFLWTASGIQQLTNTPSASGFAIGPPSISNGGQSVVFASSLDLVGSNADLNYEIFMFRAPSTLVQITSTTGSGPTGVLNDGPAISGNGQVVAFSSGADLLGANSDGSVEVYTWRASTGFQQLTDTLTNIGYPSIDAAGAAIAYVSNADLTPPLNADGSSEIFLHSPPTINQITSTTVSDYVEHPRLSQNSTRILFVSNADLLPPANADHSLELFLFDQLSGFSQLTSSTVPDFIGLPSPDAGADTVVFISNGDLLPPQNADGNTEIFVWRSAGGLTQLTVTLPTSHNTNPTTNFTGDIFAYELVTDAQRTVVLVDCHAQSVEIPAVSSSGLSLLGFLLAALGIFTLRMQSASSSWPTK